MRETEIVKGLAKAKVAMYAKGMVPHYAAGVVPEEPSIMGFIKDRAQAAMTAMTPSTAPNIATDAVMQNQGLLGGAARGLRDHQNNMDAQIKEATGFATGTPFIEGPGTGTSDSVPAMLSKGEAVLPAKTVQSIGPNNIARMIEQTNGIAPKRGLSGRTDSGTNGKYADGYVKPTAPFNPTTSLGANGTGGPALGLSPAEPSVRNLPPNNISVEKIPSLGNPPSTRTPYVNDPVARAAVNRAPPVAPQPAAAAGPAAVAEPTVAAAAETAAAPAGKTSFAQGAKNMFNSASGYVKNMVGAAAPEAEAAKSAASFFPKAVSVPAKLGVGALRAGVSNALIPATAIYSAANSYGTPTAEYQDRTSIDNELGARAAGVFQDLGNTLTAGYAGKLGDAIVRKTNGGNFFGGDAPPTSPATAAPAAPAAPAAAQPAAPNSPMQRTMAAEAQRSPAQQAEDVARLSGVSQKNTGIDDGNGQNVAKLTGQGLRSPLYTNIAPTQAVREYAQNAPNTVSAPNTASGGGGGGLAANPAVAAALAAAAGRGDFDSVKQFYEKQGQGFAGQNSATDAQDNFARQMADTAVNSSDSLGDAVLKRGQRNILQANERDNLAKRTLNSQMSTASADRAERQRSGDLDRGEKGRESDLTFNSNMAMRQLQNRQIDRQLGNDNADRLDTQIKTLAPVDKDGRPTGNYDPADLERKIIGTFGEMGIPKSGVKPEYVNEFLNEYDAGKKAMSPGYLQRLRNIIDQRRIKESNNVLNNRAVGLSQGVFTNSYDTANGNQYEVPGAGLNFDNVNTDVDAQAQRSIKRTNALAGGR